VHVIISSRARADLRSITKFVAASSPEAAERLLDELIDEALAIGAQPTTYAVIPNFRRATVRRKMVREWAILYRLRADYVDIARILQGRRDLGRVRLD
jgi:plasmid stabilization system protein ParE